MTRRRFLAVSMPGPCQFVMGVVSVPRWSVIALDVLVTHALTGHGRVMHGSTR